MSPPAHARWRVDAPRPRESRHDPYIDWAEATQYRDLTMSHGRMPVAIEMKAGGRTAQQFAQHIEAKGWHAWIWISSLYRDAPPALAHTRFCTAFVTREFFTRIDTDLADEFERITLAMPFSSGRAQHDDAMRIDTSPLVAALRSDGIGNVIVGVCEEGISATHRRFFEDASGMHTRFQSFWDHEDNARIAPGLGYGSECLKAHIDASLRTQHCGAQEEEGVYRVVGHTELSRRSDDAHEPHENALPLIGVRLRSYGSTKRDAGLWLDAQALDAVRYIIHRAQDAGGPLCHALIHLSYVTIAGPHDGSALIESALDELMDTGACSVVIPPDHSNLSRCHGVVTIAHEASLRWRLPRDCATPSFVEIWFAANVDEPDVDVQIVTPDGDRSEWIEAGEIGAYTLDDETLCTVVHRGKGARGDGHMILVALAPSIAHDDARRAAHAGNWFIRLRNNAHAQVSAVFHAARHASVCRVTQPRA